MPRLTIDDYTKLADEKNLDFIGEIHDEKTLNRLEIEFDFHICGAPPHYATDPTYWRCRLTGKVMKKAIVAVQRNEYGSRYQRVFWGDDGTYQKYKNLADKLGITFLYDPDKEFFPATTKNACRWRGRDGAIVIVSYHDIGYDAVAAEWQSRLGISAIYNEVTYVR